MNHNIHPTLDFIPSEDIIIIGEHRQIQKFIFKIIHHYHQRYHQNLNV